VVRCVDHSRFNKRHKWRGARGVMYVNVKIKESFTLTMTKMFIWAAKTYEKNVYVHDLGLLNTLRWLCVSYPIKKSVHSWKRPFKAHSSYSCIFLIHIEHSKKNIVFSFVRWPIFLLIDALFPSNVFIKWLMLRTFFWCSRLWPHR
jgi:hypothetical protein